MKHLQLLRDLLLQEIGKVLQLLLLLILTAVVFKHEGRSFLLVLEHVLALVQVERVLDLQLLSVL